MILPEITIHLPAWVEEFTKTAPAVFPRVEDRMRFVLALSRRNIQHATGGPFAAAVFDSDGRLIAPGVNMVVTSNCSVFHSEILALVIAQRILGRYDLSDGGTRHYDLFATTEPCAMCFGAVPWSGVSRLVCGARDEDARAIGFDEGPKMADWVASLNDRGIAVLRDVLRTDAVAVLQDYAKAGGPIYQAGRPVPAPKGTP
jgi:tRNA(Arg) A34 adenosine deaminase TadA